MTEALASARHAPALDARRHDEEAFTLLVESVRDHAIYVLDRAGGVATWNRGAERLTGYRAEEIMGREFGVLYPEEEAAAGKPRVHLGAAAAQGSLHTQGWRRRKDGSRFWADFSLTALRGDSGELRGFAAVTRDESERRSMREQLMHQALHDAVTGLPNRRLLLDRLDHALKRSLGIQAGNALLLLDIDRFRRVNDSLGQTCGDQLLAAVGERLKAAVRVDDTIARVGGDQFGVLCETITEPEALALAERLLEQLAAPVRLEDHDVRVSASVGVALSAAGSEDPEALLRAADGAMQLAKRSGKSGYRVSHASAVPGDAQRLRTENDLRRALEAGQLYVVYQPQVDIQHGGLVSAEALVRWQHPERGLISPSEFVPLAEETGLIAGIGEFVLDEACEQARRWASRSTGAPPGVAVNLSAAQLSDPELPRIVEHAVERSGIEPAALCLEITEHVLMEDGDASSRAVCQLHDLGVRLAIDDFGTGYSSLAYLRELPVDLLKVDGSFTKVDTPADSALVSAVASMAHALDMSVIAECVESSEQLDVLRRVGCDLAQGYYFARPGAPAQVEELAS